jgi:hypothetical protein
VEEGEMLMKFLICCLAIIGSLGVSPAMAFDEEKKDTRDQPEMELEIYAAPQRYTFQDYLSDLTDFARSDQPAPENPISRLEPKEEQKYEPWNPIVVMRW